MKRICPTLSKIALYLEQKMAESECQAMERHLALCSNCRSLVADNQLAASAAEEKPLRMPDKLRQTILLAVNQSHQSKVAKLIYRAGTHALEQILGSGQAIHLDPLPVRGGQFTSTYRVKFGEIDVDVATDKREDGSFDIWLKAKPGKKEFFRCEWQLWKGNMIREQLPSDNGEGLFSSISGGTYQLILTLSGEEVGVIDITLEQGGESD